MLTARVAFATVAPMMDHGRRFGHKPLPSQGRFPAQAHLQEPFRQRRRESSRELGGALL